MEEEKSELIERNVEVLRGGYQSEENTYYSYQHDEMLQSSPYDVVRQNEYEQLHQQMHAEPNVVNEPIVDESTR